jgi:hypothetical protein
MEDDASSTSKMDDLHRKPTTTGGMTGSMMMITRTMMNWGELFQNYKTLCEIKRVGPKRRLPLLPDSFPPRAVDGLGGGFHYSIPQSSRGPV